MNGAANGRDAASGQGQGAASGQGTARGRGAGGIGEGGGGIGASAAQSEALHGRVREFARAAQNGDVGEPFEALALDIARFQALHNPAFARLCRHGGARLERLADVPAVPADAFRLGRVAAHPRASDVARFLTSGTTGGSGCHAFRSLDTYAELSVRWGRTALLGAAAKPCVVLALAPPFEPERRSSLGYMMQLFMRELDGRALGPSTREPSSPGPSSLAERAFDPREPGRWLLQSGSVDVAGLLRGVQWAEQRGEPVLLLATSFALVWLLDVLDGAELPLPAGSVVMLTGGFKGRARSVDGAELGLSVCRTLGVAPAQLIGEYGMTELSSQLYDRGFHPVSEALSVFVEPPWLRVTPVDPRSLEPVGDGEVGLARFTDLANIDSAINVVTQDRVRRVPGGIVLLGRQSGARLRGCSLAVEALAAWPTPLASRSTSSRSTSSPAMPSNAMPSPAMPSNATPATTWPVTPPPAPSNVTPSPPMASNAARATPASATTSNATPTPGTAASGTPHAWKASERHALESDALERRRAGMEPQLAALERLARLLAAARRAVAPASPVRSSLAARLQITTGLSSAGVRWAIDHCLEQNPSDAELGRLVARVAPAPRAHVILPGSVFVAAHRALALALAAAPKVFVKPSRREPALIAALHAQAPGLFEVVERIVPEPGDHVFAYGSDTTLEDLRRSLPKGTVLHAHGSGFGVAVVDLETAPSASAHRDTGEPEAEASVNAVATSDRAMARAIAADTACFDQRGCLSPRFVLALADPLRARRFAATLASELAELERRIPLGRLDPSEEAEITWHRQCAACFGEVLAAGSGSVSQRDAAEPAWLAEEGRAALEIPPAGRHLEVIALRRLEPALEALRPWLTTVGCSSALQARVQALLEPIRIAPLGRMQNPPFDGPVDRRADPRGEVID